MVRVRIACLLAFVMELQRARDDWYIMPAFGALEVCIAAYFLLAYWEPARVLKIKPIS